MLTLARVATAVLALVLSPACSDGDKGGQGAGPGVNSGGIPTADTSDTGTGVGGWGTGDGGTGGYNPTVDVTTNPTEGISGDVTEGCTPGKATCLDENTRSVCNDVGTSTVPVPCPEGSKCLDGYCAEPICTPGEQQDPPKCSGSNSFKQCNDSGTAWEDAYCDAGLTCFEGECVNLVCPPNSAICFGTSALKRCNDDGSGWLEPELCTQGALCQLDANGFAFCADACEANVKQNTYLGCDYWAADLDNVDEGQYQPIAVVVSAPPDGNDAKVTITATSDGHTLTPAELGATTDTVAKGQLEVFILPTGHDLDGSTKVKESFRIQTSAPVTVHQFNPFKPKDETTGGKVYTNDASLLLPSNVGGQEYYVMSWSHRADDLKTYRGFLTVVATQKGVTTVSVTPRGTVSAGPGVPSMVANQTTPFQLEQGEVLNLETDGVQGQDLTGTRIASDKRVAVFSGHECANIPLGVNFCDHIEQQLFPVHAWGSHYVADTFAPRSEGQFDIFRIIGGADDIFVVTDPPIEGYESFTLNKGQVVQFLAKDSFTITASAKPGQAAPIMVGHYMIGSNYPGSSWTCGTSGSGDPALTLSVPSEQFLDTYTVLTPPDYEQDFLNIIAKPGTVLTLDGAPLEATFTPLGSGEWGVVQLPVPDGVHTVSGDSPFGLTAYGYDCDVSYAYPGGLKLDAIKQQ